MPRNSTKRQSKRELIKKLDKVFSEWVRNKGSDSGGYVSCYTCGKRDHWKKMQCGHFISRASYALRWEPDNARVQCVGCNMFKAGNQYVFGKKLEKELGESRIQQMMEIKHDLSGFTQQDYLDMIELYK